MANKKGAKKKNKNFQPAKRVLIFKEDMQEYCKMTKMLGGLHIMVMLPDKSEVMAVIPGRFRKRCFMKVGDVLIVSMREYEESKCDVCYKYLEDEVRMLATYNEIPNFFLDSFDNSNEDFEFCIDSEEENQDVDIDNI